MVIKDKGRARNGTYLGGSIIAVEGWASNLSDLGDRREHDGRARTEFHDFEAHSGAMQREIGELWAALPSAHDCRDAGGRATQEQLPRDGRERLPLATILPLGA